MKMKARTISLPATVRHLLDEDSGFNIRRGDIYVVTRYPKAKPAKGQHRVIELARADLSATPKTQPYRW